MKTNIKTIVIMLLATAFVASCSKYEDGPKISLRTKKARLSNTWKLELYTINGQDKTQEFLAIAGQNYRLRIEKDGKYSTEGNFPDQGTWELGEDKDDIRLKSNDPNTEEQSYRILRLKNDETWVKQTQSNGDVWEYHFKSE